MSQEKKFSSLFSVEELQKSADFHEAELRMDAQKRIDSLRVRAIEILSLFAATPEINRIFLIQSVDDMSAFIFTHRSEKCVIVDMLARCPRDQIANFDTYKFTSHQEFEKKISQYTRTAEKPNNQLAKCRPWDVALNIVLKIEALDSEAMKNPSSRHLFREYHIVKHLWDYYMRENMELDEMTGIPIVFKYDELPNPIYNYDSGDYKVFDCHGNLVTAESQSESRSTLSYLCIEQLGPHVQYLMDLMSSRKTRGHVFDMDTSFKIFDQLLCRCLQMHRFGVVHNAIEPGNLYFGRSIAFNVLYVTNFSVATLLDRKDPNNMRKSTVDPKFYGHLRYASHMRLKRSQPHPVHDLESAFYTLIGMLTNNLPWDNCLSSTGTASKDGSHVRSSGVEVNASNPVSAAAVQESDMAMKAIERNSMLQKLREAKSNFWRSTNGIARVLADLQYLALGHDRKRVALASEIMKELYSKIRDLLFTIGSEAPDASFYSSLLLQHTNEYQMYTDLRRTVLMMYRFESLSAFINTPTYQKKVESLAHVEQEGTVRLAWNLTNWCFNGVELSTTNVPARVSIVHSSARNAGRTTD